MSVRSVCQSNLSEPPALSALPEDAAPTPPSRLAPRSMGLSSLDLSVSPPVDENGEAMTVFNVGRSTIHAPIARRGDVVEDPIARASTPAPEIPRIEAKRVRELLVNKLRKDAEPRLLKAVLQCNLAKSLSDPKFF